MTPLLHHGECVPWLASLEAKSVDHIIADPPYDAHVHGKVRSGRVMPDDQDFDCRARRSVDLGFAALDADGIDALAKEYARLVKRWVILFSNAELAHVWRDALIRHGLDFVRTGAWVKLRATPQFTGDRPGAGFDAITIAHPKGRKRWNGGGKQGIWTHPVVANCNGHRQDRVHTTQKPLSLMIELVQDFTDRGDLILDSHMGSASTGVAALRLGRRFMGAEMQPRPEHPEDADYFNIARDRLGAEQVDSDLTAARAGQLPMFVKAG